MMPPRPFVFSVLPFLVPTVLIPTVLIPTALIPTALIPTALSHTGTEPPPKVLFGASTGKKIFS